jgi:hypothetical protein
MTARPDPAALRTELAALLQEDDPHRRLDSLESVVIGSYLTNRALAPALPVRPPTTIEGWVTWVARHSAIS